jgi:hypothetical protein
MQIKKVTVRNQQDGTVSLWIEGVTDTGKYLAVVANDVHPKAVEGLLKEMAAEFETKNIEDRNAMLARQPMLF